MRSWNGLLSLLLALLLGAAGSRAEAQEGTGSIRGVVVDVRGEPLAGAQVTVAGTVRRGAAVGEDGAFRVTSLPPGSYTVRIRAIGHDPVEREVRVAAGEESALELRLDPAPIALAPLEVTSVTRTAELLAGVPGSVTVLDQKDLERQATVTSDLGAMLAHEVPGLAQSTGTLSNYGQTLRGRDVGLLIDGVPQNTPLRNASRWMHSIDPTALERVEVVRGATALYGYEATGGVINLITRRPPVDGVHYTTEVGSRFSPGQVGESFQGRVMQQVGGRSGRFDFLVNGAYERWGYFYDAEGDLIPQDPQGQGGLAHAAEQNFLGRLGVQLAPEQRLTFSANYYRFLQDIEYESVAGPDGKALAVKPDQVRGKDPGTENLVATLGYSHDDLRGSRVSARAFLHDYVTRFGFYPYHPGGGKQGYVSSDKVGARLDVETPLPARSGAALLWGLDLLRDETAQPFVEGGYFVPPMAQRSTAPFAQLRLPLGRLLLRGGVRYEDIAVAVDDYTTIYVTQPVEGGTLRYDALLANLGGVVELSDAVQLFGSFSQGFSVVDIGRVLRSPVFGKDREQIRSVEQLDPEAQKVNSYDLGVRGGSGVLRGGVSAFLSTSDLGATFGDLPELRIVRSPERVWGVEADFDAQPTPRWGFGGSATYLEGKRDSDEDGDYDLYLPGDRIPPLKLTGYASYAPTPRWQNRVQALYSGERDRFEGPLAKQFSYGAVESYTTVDLLSTVELGRGTLRLGVENLFDEFYFPPVAQWYNFPQTRAAAPGRTVSVGYTLRY